MSIRPTSDNIKIGLLQERVLYSVTHYARRKGVIPKKTHPDNIIPDLSLPIRTDNEARMLSILEERTYNSSFNNNLEQGGLLLLALREQAGAIFDLLSEKKEFLYQEDFKCITSSHDVQRRYFTAFNYSLEEKINRKDFIFAVESIYTGRKKIWNSYLDRRALADIMRTIFGIAFWIIAFILFFLIAGISFSSAILPLSSFVLGFGFAFKNIMALMVESFVLMLVVRPFDVGDIIAIGYVNPERFEVISIGLFRTLFRRTDGKFVSVPNSELINTSILNLTRSDSYVYWTPVMLSFDGRISSILALKKKIEDYIEEHPDLTDGGCWVERVPKTNDLMFYYCYVAPKVSWARRRDQEELKLEFILFFQKEARKLGIKLKKPDQTLEWLTPIKPDSKYVPRMNQSGNEIRQRPPTDYDRDRFIQ